MSAGLHRQLRLRLVAAALSSLTIACSPEAEPLARAGILDLSRIDLQNHDVELRGQWFFQPAAFVAPDAPPAQAAWISAPGNWNSALHGGLGAGSYWLKIRLNPATTQIPLALGFLPLGPAYRCFANGVELFAAGRPALNKESAMAGYRAGVVPLPPGGATLDLVCHLSNYHHRSGGMWYALRLGELSRLELRRNVALLRDFALCGALLILAAYHLLLFSSRRGDIAPLAFGAFCAAIALRALFVGEYYAYSIWPGAPWEWMVRIEYLCHIIALPLFVSYSALVYGGTSGRYFVAAFAFAGAGFAAHTLLSSPREFTKYLLHYQLLIGAGAAYLLFRQWLAHRRGSRGALAAMAGGAVFALAILNDVLYARALIDSAYLTPLGLVVFLVAQTPGLTLTQPENRRALWTVRPHSYETGRAPARGSLALAIRLQANDDETAAACRTLLNASGFRLRSSTDGSLFFSIDTASGWQADLPIQLYRSGAIAVGVHWRRTGDGIREEPSQRAAENLAERAAGCGAGVVFDAASLAALDQPGRYLLRMIDRTALQPGDPQIAIYELLESRDRTQRSGEGRIAEFELGVQAMLAGDFDRACGHFEARLEASPDDRVAECYRQRCLDAAARSESR